VEAGWNLEGFSLMSFMHEGEGERFSGMDGRRWLGGEVGGGYM